MRSFISKLFFNLIHRSDCFFSFLTFVGTATDMNGIRSGRRTGEDLSALLRMDLAAGRQCAALRLRARIGCFAGILAKGLHVLELLDDTAASFLFGIVAHDAFVVHRSFYHGVRSCREHRDGD